ncbi:MAG: hypothetical protein V4645_12650 [Pseudomonadota bacterium]
MTNFIDSAQDGPVVTLTMNKPHARSSLTGNIGVASFQAATERIHADASVRALILTSVGAAFSRQGTSMTPSVEVSHKMLRFVGPERTGSAWHAREWICELA